MALIIKVVLKVVIGLGSGLIIIWTL